MAKRKNTVNAPNITKILIGLIGVLAVILVAVILVAVLIRPGQQGDGSTEPQQTDPPIEFKITQPTERQFIALENKILFAGQVDPAESLKINGNEVARNNDGTFSVEVPLTLGKNEIVVTHEDEAVTYTVEHRYAVSTFYPAEADVTYNCGATMQVSLFVRDMNNVQVNASINGQQIAMKKADNQVGSGAPEGFLLYTGTYKMPNNNQEDLNLGKLTYTVTYGGITETYTSGTITCKKAPQILSSDPSVTPNYGNYINVGSGYIVEIITSSAETFVGTNRNDYSDPRNNYLPKGTVDYASSEVITSPSGSQSFRLMRCGYKVYVQKKNYPPSSKLAVVDCYRGSLPDHNEIGFASVDVVGSHTILTLDTLWKAPFYFDIAPQSYAAPGDRNFAVSKLTAEYVDITFCYATKFEGEVNIPANNPLFSRAELTQKESDCTLRLYLKKAGSFYGWDAHYNENDQLCFRFLNPVKATATSGNKYGANLTGIRILLDVGHGGIDGGAVAKDANGKEIVDEAELNLQLALKLKAELESMGATVILNRTTDASIRVQDRIDFLKEQAPDLCIAIHQNSGEKDSYNGGWVCYYTPFSLNAANAIYTETQKTGVYQKTVLYWDQTKYYVARETACPVVLMENGFMTNAKDFASMMNENDQQLKVEAMAKGIAKYFLNMK